MDNLQTIIADYLDFCENQKRLDSKTLRAYRIDLAQFSAQTAKENVSEINPDILEQFIADLHRA